MKSFSTRLIFFALVPLIAISWAVWVNPLFLDRPVMGFFLCFLVAFGLTVVVQPLSQKIPAIQNPLRWSLIELGFYIFLCLRPTPAPVSSKLLIVGIDGAHWSLVERFSLSALQNIKRKSISGPLQADKPLFSPLLWTTIASGKIPAEHGIRGFRTQSSDAKVARFWEIASANDLSVGLYKWLVTWPPTPLKGSGFMVPAWLSPSPETWPAELSVVKEIELSRRLRRRNFDSQRSNFSLAVSGVSIGFRLSTLIDAVQLSMQQRLFRLSEEHVAWSQQLLRIQMDRDVFVHQLQTHQPDVAALTLYATDALGHTHWKWLDCQNDCPPFASAVSDAYGQADAVLEELQQHVDKNTAVLVLSDHGFRPANAEDAARRFQPKTENLRSLLLTEFPDLDVAKLGQKMIVSLPVDASPSEIDRLHGAIDSLVIFETGEPLYVAEPMTGAPWSIGLTLRPQRVVEQDLQRFHVGEKQLGEFISLLEPFSGEHDEQGIFALYVPDLSPKAVVVHQLDVLPTILAVLELPPALDLSGKSLLPNPQQAVDSYDGLRAPTQIQNIDINTEMLQQLGYID